MSVYVRGGILLLLLALVPAIVFAATPTADDKSASTEEATAVAITLSSSDPDTHTPLPTFSVTTGPTNGTLSAISGVTRTGNTTTALITYTPNAGFGGVDTFTYDVNDNSNFGSIASGTVTVTVLKLLPPSDLQLPGESQVPTTGSVLLDKIGQVGNWVFAIFLAISLIYIVLAAYEFVTGQGSPEKMATARQKLIYSAMGIAIALLAAGFDNIMRSIITGS